MPPLRPRIILGVLFAALAPAAASAWDFNDTGAPGTLHHAVAVAVDHRNDVVAAGTFNQAYFAVKLHRRDGRELWRFQLNSGGATAVAVDSRGHVVVLGGTGGGVAIIKLDGESGTPHWTALLNNVSPLSVAVDGADDVVAAGQVGNEMGVVKLRGVDGHELCRAQAPGAQPGGQARALAVDGSGDALVAGALVDANFQRNFAVVKFDGGGSVLWRHEIPRHEFCGCDVPAPAWS